MFCEGKSSAVDSGWSWVILAAVSHVQGMTYGMTLISGFFYNAWLEEFKSDHATTACLTSVPVFVMYFASPLFPMACRRFNSTKWVSLMLTAFLPLSFLLSAFANSVSMLFFTYSFLSGIGLVSWSAVLILLVKYFDKYLGVAIAVVTSCGYASTFYMAPLCDHLIRAYGWRTTFLILSALLTATCFPCVLLYKDHVNDACHQQPSRTVLSGLIKSMQFWIVALSFGLLAIEYVTFSTHIVEFGMRRKLAEISKVRTLSIYYSAGNLVGRLSITPLVERLSNKLRAYKIVLLLTATCALAGLLCRTFKHMAVIVTIYGAFEGGTETLQTIVLVAIFDKERFPEAMTLIMTIQAFFLLTGPVIVGAVMDVTGNYDVLFYLLAFVTFASAVVLACLKCLDENPSEKTNLISSQNNTEEYVVYT